MVINRLFNIFTGYNSQIFAQSYKIYCILYPVQQIFNISISWIQKLNKSAFYITKEIFLLTSMFSQKPQIKYARVCTTRLEPHGHEMSNFQALGNASVWLFSIMAIVRAKCIFCHRPRIYTTQYFQFVARQRYVTALNITRDNNKR